MPNFIVLAIGIMLLCANIAAAQTECPALTKISHISETIISNHRAADAATVIETIGVITAETTHIERNLLETVFSKASNATERETLLSFFTTLSDVMRHNANNDNASATTLLKSPQMIILAYKVNEILATGDCAPLAPPESNSQVTQRDAVARSGQPKSIPPEPSDKKNAQNGLKIAATVVAFAAFAFVAKNSTRNSSIGAGVFTSSAIVAAFLSWKGKRKLRLKRHALYYVVRWRKLGSSETGHEGVILDINSFGAKLCMPNPPQAGEVGEIQLQGNWHKARVRWSKEGSSGLKLAQRLRLTAVSAILKESRDPNFQSTAEAT